VSQGMCPDFLFFHYFQFKLTLKSIKELGSASLVKNKSSFGELAKMEEKNICKIETWSRNYNCEIVKSSKVKIKKKGG
jgi:hypothetical protein